MGATRSRAQRAWIKGACAPAAAVALAALIAGAAAAADGDSPQPLQDAAPAAKTIAAKPLLPASQVKAGTLVVFNRPILTFRANFIGNSPAQRVENSRERIKLILARNGPGKVTVEDIPQGNVVKIDDAPAFFVTDGDADALAGQSRESLVRDAVKALEQAI